MKLMKTKFILMGIALIMLLTFSFAFSAKVEAKTSTKPTYTITTKTKPINKTYSKLSTYNSKTKQYYTLRSYLEKLEKTKGGKLIFKKGTYTITNVLYVPSNVTIEFSNGVKVVKGTSTGTSKMSPSYSIFQLIRPSKAKKSGVYGEFNGEKNIKFIGKGNVTIDLKYYEASLAIIIGHNQKIEVNNINFRNMYGGHFIELDASKNVKILNSSFKKSKHTPDHDKEAINLDTPDKSTHGWSQKWSKFDATANDTVLIENNEFEGLDRAVGTHKYSHNKLHNNVTIRKNTIYDMRSDSIRVMNWSNPVIEYNSISLPSDTDILFDIRGILVSGVSNPTFQNNTFSYIPRPMQFIVWKNSDGGSEIPIYNTLSDANKQAILNNTISNASEAAIRINNKAFGDYSNTEYIRFPTSVRRNWSNQ